MKLILEDNFSDLSYQTEINESTGEKTYVVTGTFSTPDQKNRNGRIYSKKLWEENVARYQDEIKNNTVNTLMEAEHPPRTSVDMWKAVGKIRKLEMRDNIVYGEAIILNNNTQESNQLKALIEAGIPIGVSTRGTGRLKGNIVEEYNLVTVDFVSSPSDKGANLKGMIESKELFTEDWILKDKDFVNENGAWVCNESGCEMKKIVEDLSPASKILKTLTDFFEEPSAMNESEKKALDLLNEVTKAKGKPSGGNGLKAAVSDFWKAANNLKKWAQDVDKSLASDLEKTYEKTKTVIIKIEKV